MANGKGFYQRRYKFFHHYRRSKRRLNRRRKGTTVTNQTPRKRKFGMYLSFKKRRVAMNLQRLTSNYIARTVFLPNDMVEYDEEIVSNSANAKTKHLKKKYLLPTSVSEFLFLSI